LKKKALMVEESPVTVTAPALGNILLHIGTMLLHAGAGSKRVITNISRIADAYGFVAHATAGTRSISITLQSRSAQGNAYTGTRNTGTLPGVNFAIITAVSRLSWAVTEKPLSLEILKSECIRIQKIPHYSRGRIVVVVGLAGLSFCYIFGGALHEMLVTFAATMAGMALKQLMVRKQFNTYVVTYCAATLASLVVGIAATVFRNISFEHAFSTCSLFLIPGVPMVISFIDLLNGYILTALDRGVNASIHAFSIAAGIITIIYIFGLV
jgi:uncharacterized membrane protein YjjP (DUF1212 family)